MSISRRAFLAGAGALGGVAFGLSPRSRLAHSSVTRAPVRVLLVHKPAGTVPELYDCAGEGSDFALSPILEPFADLRSHMVVIDGLENRKQANTPNEDHGNGIITFMTGGIPFRPEGSHVALAERVSIDQIFAASSAFSGVPIRSLQLTADGRTSQLFVRVLSYAGRGAPLPAEQSPVAAFVRVFGSISDGALSPADLERLRARKQSILDFARGDLARLRPRLGAEERLRLDRHAQSIREVEQVIHRTAGLDPGTLGSELRAIDLTKLDENHGAIGRAHLDVVRTAFQCDLTRVACFTWGGFELDVGRAIPGCDRIDHHLLSHADRPDQFGRVHRWYHERLAEFLRTLRDTPDIDGATLLDNTLVIVWSEMRTGSHAFDNTPVILFGGAGGRLQGNRLVRYGGYGTNDLWCTIANALGTPMPVFGDKVRNTGRLSGLFRSSPLDRFGADPAKAK